MLDDIERVSVSIAGAAWDGLPASRQVVTAKEAAASGGTARIDDAHFLIPDSELVAKGGPRPDIGSIVTDAEGLSWIAVEREIDRTMALTDLLCRRSEIVLDPGSGTTFELQLEAPAVSAGPGGNPVRTWTSVGSSFAAAVIELGGETIEERERQGLRVTHTILVPALVAPSVDVQAGRRFRRVDNTAVYVIKSWSSRNDGSDFWPIQVEQVT